MYRLPSSGTLTSGGRFNPINLREGLEQFELTNFWLKLFSNEGNKSFVRSRDLKFFVKGLQ